MDKYKEQIEIYDKCIESIKNKIKIKIDEEISKLEI